SWAFSDTTTRAEDSAGTTTFARRRLGTYALGHFSLPSVTLDRGGDSAATLHETQSHSKQGSTLETFTSLGTAFSSDTGGTRDSSGSNNGGSSGTLTAGSSLGNPATQGDTSNATLTNSDLDSYAFSGGRAGPYSRSDYHGFSNSQSSTDTVMAGMTYQLHQEG